MSYYQVAPLQPLNSERPTLREREGDMSNWVEIKDEFIDLGSVVHFWFSEHLYGNSPHYHLHFIFNGIKNDYSIQFNIKDEVRAVRAFLRKELQRFNICRQFEYVPVEKSSNTEEVKEVEEVKGYIEKVEI